MRIVRGPFDLLGTGSALPGGAISTEQLLETLSQRFGIKSSFRARAIAKRMGVLNRHFCRDLTAPLESPRLDSTNPRISASALQRALAGSGLDVSKLGYLLGHTASPHTHLPPNIAWVADEMNFQGPYAEFRQACTGFANALQFAAGLLKMNPGSPVGIVGSETGSVYFRIANDFIDDEQMVNLVQMGDGAGAVIIGAAGGGARGTGQIESLFYGNLGSGRAPGFWLEDGGSANVRGGNGFSVFRHSFEGVRERGPELFEAAVGATRQLGIQLANIDWFLPHQANGKMDIVLSELLDIPRSKVIVDGRDVGNLGSASIWVAFDRFLRSGRMSVGQTLLVLGAEATKYMYGGFIYKHGASI